LVAQIDELGGEAIEFPVIRIQPPSGAEAQAARDAAMQRLPSFDWVVFTSVNGVDSFFTRLRELRVDIRSLAQARIAAVGPKTAEALEQRGLIVEKLPPKFQADSLFDTLAEELRPGQTVLLATADIAGKELPRKLEAFGLEVTKIDVYENVLDAEDAPEIVELLKQGMIHDVTFTSSSTVTNLFTALTDQGEDPLALLSGCRIACIGPITAKTAEDSGLSVDYLAEESTIASLVASMCGRPGERLIQG